MRKREEGRRVGEGMRRRRVDEGEVRRSRGGVAKN